MSKTVSFSYRWDAANCMKAAEAAYRHRLRHSPMRFAGWIFIAMTQFGVVAAMKKGSVGLLLLGTVLVIYWYFLRWPLRRAALKRRCAKNTEETAHTVTVDEEGLHTEKTTIPWHAVNSVVSLSDGFLINLDRDYLFFPKAAFKEDAASIFSALAGKYALAYRKE